MSQLQRYRDQGLYGTPYEYPDAGSGPDGKDQLEEIIDTIYQGKWIILLSFLVVFGASIGYLYMQESTYQASSLVMISSGQNASSSSGAAGMYGFATPTMQWGRSVDSELLLLRNSQELPRQVASRLVEMSEQYDQPLASILVPPEAQAEDSLTQASDTLSQQEVAQYVGQYISFSASDGGLIQFQALTPTPHLAPLLANLYAEEYVDLTQEMSRASLVATRKFLEQQQQQQLEKLNQAEARIQNYLERKGTVSIDAEGNQLISQISQLEARRDQIQIEIDRRKASIQALRSSLEQIQPQLAQSIGSTVSQDIQLLVDKLAQLKAQRREAIINNPEWENPSQRPAIQKLDGQIQRLQDTLDQLSNQYVAQTISSEGTGSDSTAVTDGMARAVSLKQQIQAQQIAITGLQAEADALDQLIQQYRSDLQTIPGESMQMAELQRNRERIASTYEYLTQRLQEVSIKEQSELGYASVIAEATEATAVQPGRERVLILGGFFGILLGLGLALMRQKFDNRLYKPDQIEAQGYNATVVPDMKGFIKSEYGGKALIKKNGRDVATTLITLHNGAATATEAYRQLRTNVQFALSDATSNVIVVTSPGVGEGKSTTAANLAVSFAQGGFRTLLVDADMRRPQVHNFLGLSLKPGLSQMLQKEIECDPSNMETGVKNLYAITAGQASGENASELIGSSQMRELLGLFREQFDIVIIDTPPTLAVTESKQLAPKADATLMVARAGETKEKELDFAARELERVGGKILGVVLNSFNLKMAYSYKYRYSTYDAYDSEHAGYVSS